MIADPEHADVERGCRRFHVAKMTSCFGACLMDVAERRSGKFQLPARLERHRTAVTVDNPDDVSLLHDRLGIRPEFGQQAFQKRAHPGLAVIGDRRVILSVEQELFMLGADFPAVSRRFAIGNPADHLADVYGRVIGFMHGGVSVLKDASRPLRGQALDWLCVARPPDRNLALSCPITTNGLEACQRRNGRRIGAQYARAERKFQTILTACNHGSFGVRKSAFRADKNSCAGY